VVDLTSWFDENPDLKEQRFPSTFGAATVNNKLYAVPIETVTPIVFYWNKTLFDQVGAEPPQSWGDILDLVPKFNAKGIAPFSLAGQSLWTNMMWLEFLFDRIGWPGRLPGRLRRREGTPGATQPHSRRSARRRSWSRPNGLPERASRPLSPTRTPTRRCCSPARPR
jgi:hypothetical protein